MFYSAAVVALGVVSAVSAQNNLMPPPPLGTLTTTLSGVLPVLPTPFNGVRTNQGAIIAADKIPFNLNNPLVTPVGGLATTVTNAIAATYVATLPEVPFNALVGSVIRGSIMASSTAGQVGTTFTFNLTGFPNVTQYGTFPYHIHQLQVPSDGNCTETKGHFDPYNVGELILLNNTVPPTYLQAGDLAGKHARINTTTFSMSYVDYFLSTDPSSNAFFGAKSIVFHITNSTRITCANFMMADNGTSPLVPMPSAALPTPSTPAMATSTSTTTAPVGFTGAASKNAIGAGSILVLLSGLFML